MLLASSHLSLSLSRKKMKNETRDNSRDFDTCHQPSLSFYFLSAGKMLTRTEIRENSSLWKKREKKIPKSEWDGKKKKKSVGMPPGGSQVTPRRTRHLKNLQTTTQT